MMRRVLNETSHSGSTVTVPEPRQTHTAEGTPPPSVRGLGAEVVRRYADCLERLADS